MESESLVYHITNREWFDDEAEEWWSSPNGGHGRSLTGWEMREFLKRMIEKAQERGRLEAHAKEFVEKYGDAMKNLSEK